ncbi:IPT/TIG domain-containing protein [Parasediminibacterium sp. JCM 36343]|uniref:RCC1 domain-containing protein n=1 Tax=Parasediminibacterium sp. JCM 36343 TaxID=3374279 RepID=UPI00397937D4
MNQKFLQVVLCFCAIIWQDMFLANAQAPTITSFTPSSTCPGKTATVFITGSNFTGATAVTIGGKAASSFTVNSAMLLTINIPANTTGTIKVTTPKGTVTTSSSFSNTGGYTAYAYLANGLGNTVSFLNAATNKVVSTVAVGRNPKGISTSRDGAKVYVANQDGNTVSIINTATATVAATVAVGSTPIGIVASLDGKKVYVANYSDNTVSVINTIYDSVIATVFVGKSPYGITASPDGAKVYVTNLLENTVSVISTASDSAIATVAVGNAPFGITASPDGTKVYVANEDDYTVSVINTANDSVTTTVSVGDYPFSICASPDGTRMYVANAGGNSVSVINTASDSLIATIGVGIGPYGISITPDGTKVYVTSEEDTISVISTSSNAVTATVYAPALYAFGNFIANVPTACPVPPTITSFTPTTATTGTTVTIFGTGFTGATSVSFGGVTDTAFTVVNDNTITAIIVTGASGSVSVTKAGGTGTKNGFIYATGCWKAISTGYYHSVGIKTDGSLWAWGNNTYGQLGDGTTINRTNPVRIGTDTKWQSISLGNVHTIAMKADGTLWAWGFNGSGQLGDGSTNNSTSPIQIGTAKDWQDISTGNVNNMAIKTDGTLWAWGHNSGGQLGNGTTDNATSPIQIGNANNWQSVSAGGNHTVSIKKDGSLWAWGFNGNGQLGNGTTADEYSPVQIGTANNWQLVSAGENHTMAIKADSSLWAWGYNGLGELGDGTTTNADSPKQIGTATNWQFINAKYEQTFALNSNGSLWGWGNNNEGELGDGTAINRTSPVQIVSTNNWQFVSPGYNHTIAIETDGSLWAWGWNDHGQLGDGTTTNSKSPVSIGCPITLKLPAISSFSPTIAIASTRVTILGTGFTGAKAVNFGGTAASSYTVVNDSTIKAIVAIGASGSISVTTSAGTATKAGFSFVVTPTIASFTPSSTCPGKIATVFITGSNFTGATAVTIGGKAATSFTVNSATSITATIPANATGNIKVTTQQGTVASSSSFYNSGGYTALAYIANSADNTVSVVNTTINKVVSTVAVGSYPLGVSASTDGAKVYITNNGDNTVSVIRTANDSVIATVAVGSRPYGIVASPDGKKVYVANYDDNSVSVINIVQNSLAATVLVGNHPYALAASSNGAKVYVTNLYDNTVSVINTANDSVIATVAVGNFSCGILATPDGSKVYVTNEVDSSVSVVSTANDSVIATVDVGSKPFAISGSPDGTKVYVANSGGNTLSVINTATNIVVATVAVGSGPYAISTSPDGTKVYVSNSDDNTVCVVNTSNNTATATVPVGSTPFSIGNFIANVPTACGVPPTIASFNPTTGSIGTTVTIFGTGFTGATSVSFGSVQDTTFTVENDSTITATVGSGASGSVIVTTNSGTATKAGFVFTASLPNYTWTGTTSTDWGVATNWSNNFLPSSSNTVTIPSAAANQPVLTANTTIGAIVLNGSLSLNEKTLMFTGAVSGTGSIKSSAASSFVVNGTVGTLYFDASSNTIQNVTITSGSATLGNALNITGTFTPTAGTFNTGGYLTLKSTSIANTAVVGVVGGTVTGNVTIERYIPKGYKAFRQLCTGGVYNAGSIFDNWQEGGASPAGYGMYVFGEKSTTGGSNPATGIDKTDSGRNSLYDYTGYMTYSPITNTKTTMLDPYKGFYGVVYGDRTASLYPGATFDANIMMNSATTIRTKGQLVTGTVTYTTTGITGAYNSSFSILPLHDTGTLIANPYAAVIDWAGLSKTNLSNSYWYVDPTFLNGAYQVPVAYNAFANTNSNPASSKINQYIQPGQAFWVFTDSNITNTRQLVITENDKVIGSTKTAVFGTAAVNRIAISLWKGTDNLDGAVAVFGSGFAKSYGKEDSKKMYGNGENIFIPDAGKALCIDGLPLPTSSDNIPLEFAQLKAGNTYKLQISAAEFAAPGLAAYLVDKYLVTQTAISNSSTFSFVVTSNADTYTNRFSIVFKPTVLPLQFVAATAVQQGSNVNVGWTTANESNLASYTVEKSVDGISYASIGTAASKNTAAATYRYADSSVAAGTVYYRIKATGKDGSIAYSNVVLLTTYNVERTTISLYPNPVTGKSFTVKLSNLASGKYVVALYAADGRQAIAKTVSHIGGTLQQLVSLNKNLANGVYTVKVSGQGFVYQTKLIINN